MEMYKRHRRIRSNSFIRGMVQDVYLHKDDFIYPLFINTLKDSKIAIKSMPGINQLSGKYLFQEIEHCLKVGINKFLLFGIPSNKDSIGSDSWNRSGVIQKNLKEIKKRFPNTYLISDICFCEYTEHGHCGVLDKNNYLNNDKTLINLAKQSLSHAEFGADMLAPSGMLDGMVFTIRNILDKNGFEELPIMSYSVKYASSFYGPFRDAAESGMKEGDRKSHQLNVANSHWEAISEAEEDIKQGADIIMVKPAMPNLDIISTLKNQINAPIAAYQVSGEFTMLKHCIEKGFLKVNAIEESLICIKRAGATIIISYFAKEIAGTIINC